MVLSKSHHHHKLEIYFDEASFIALFLEKANPLLLLFLILIFEIHNIIVDNNVVFKIFFHLFEIFLEPSSITMISIGIIFFLILIRFEIHFLNKICLLYEQTKIDNEYSIS